MSIIIDSINENVLLTTFKAKIKSDYHKRKCHSGILYDIDRDNNPLITLPYEIGGEYKGQRREASIEIKVEGDDPVFSLPLKALKYKSKGTFTTLYFDIQDIEFMYFNNLIMNTFFNGSYLTYGNITSVLKFDSSSKIKFSLFPKELETDGVPIFTLNESKRDLTVHFFNRNSIKIGNKQPVPISLGNNNLVGYLSSFPNLLKTNNRVINESHHNISNNMKSLLLDAYRVHLSLDVFRRYDNTFFG